MKKVKKNARAGEGKEGVRGIEKRRGGARTKGGGVSQERVEKQRISKLL